MVILQLTESERVAKDHMIRLLTEGSKIPCDIDATNLTATLPTWYNDEKYKTGQKYFRDNRFGHMMSNFCGLLTLIGEPKGLKILMSTEKSSTKETARRRYVSTILHMLSWYEIDLAPGSKSWESLNRVRKMHLNASKSAERKNIGHISQTELSLTTFGFMGFALVKPHLLGIRHDNNKDREGFIHFWAVMGHMLGVMDKYNICLYPLEVVEQICYICLRYIFIPILQLETPEFKLMTQALTDGLAQFIPNLTYENQYFLTKRVAGIPGYQYNVDMSKEILCRSVFNDEEIKTMHCAASQISGYEYLDGIVFDHKIRLLNIKRIDDCVVEANEDTGISGCDHKIRLLNIKRIDDCAVEANEDTGITGFFKSTDENSVSDLTPLHKILGLTQLNQLEVVEVDDNGFKNLLGDYKLKTLSLKDQFIIRSRVTTLKFYEYRIGRMICEQGLSLILYRQRRFLNQKK